MSSWKQIIVSGSDASLANVTANTVSASFSGSFRGDGSGLTGIVTILPANVVSSSAQISTEISGAFNGASSSFSTRVYNLESKTIYSGSFLGVVYIEPSASVNASVNGVTTTFRANEIHAFGDAVFINATGSMQLGNATNTSSSLCVAMAAQNIPGNATGSYLMFGIARNDSWNWTPGGLIFLSKSGSTANTMTQTNSTGSNEVTQILGVATHADRIIFNPQYVQVITE